LDAAITNPGRKPEIRARTSTRDNGIQSLTNGNNPPSFVFPYREQSSISGNNEVGFSGKRRAYDDIVIWIRGKTWHKGGPYQSNQFGIQVNNLVNRQQRSGDLPIEFGTGKNVC
jgi:hypothetical protein